MQSWCDHFNHKCVSGLSATPLLMTAPVYPATKRGGSGGHSLPRTIKCKRKSTTVPKREINHHTKKSLTGSASGNVLSTWILWLKECERGILARERSMAWNVADSQQASSLSRHGAPSFGGQKMLDAMRARTDLWHREKITRKKCLRIQLLRKVMQSRFK